MFAGGRVAILSTVKLTDSAWSRILLELEVVVNIDTKVIGLKEGGFLKSLKVMLTVSPGLRVLNVPLTNTLSMLELELKFLSISQVTPLLAPAPTQVKAALFVNIDSEVVGLLGSHFGKVICIIPSVGIGLVIVTFNVNESLAPTTPVAVSKVAVNDPAVGVARINPVVVASIAVEEGSKEATAILLVRGLAYKAFVIEDTLNEIVVLVASWSKVKVIVFAVVSVTHDRIALVGIPSITVHVTVISFDISKSFVGRVITIV